MNPFVSNFAVLWMLLIVFLFFSPSTCETTQQTNVDDGSYLRASVPCKGIRAIFPCGKTEDPFSGEKIKDAPMNISKSEYHWEKIKLDLPWETTLPPWSWKRTDGFDSWKIIGRWNGTKVPISTEKTRDPFLPSNLTTSPLPWKVNKAPLFTNKTQDPFLRNITFRPWSWKITSDPWSWKKTKNPYPWEVTRAPYPWWKVTKAPYPWEVTRAPFPWEVRTTPYPWWKVTKAPYPWEVTRAPYPWEVTRTPYPWWKLTKAPYPWEVTRTPYPWWKVTRAPYPWDREITSKNYNKINYSNNDTTVKVLLIVGVVIIGSVALGIKYCLCKNNECSGDENSNTTQPILHPPPRSPITANSNRNYFTSATTRTELHSPTSISNRTQMTSTTANFNTQQFRTPPLSVLQVDIHAGATDRDQSRNINSSRTTFIPIINPSTTNSSRMPCSDKPPDYSSVVLDNLDENTKFPEVMPLRIPDSPPPPYDKTYHI